MAKGKGGNGQDKISSKQGTNGSVKIAKKVTWPRITKEKEKKKLFFFASALNLEKIHSMSLGLLARGSVI